jgi:hypothetical protein
MEVVDSSEAIAYLPDYSTLGVIAVILQIPILEVLGSNTSMDTVFYEISFFHDLIQSLHANTGIISRLGPQLFRYKFLQIQRVSPYHSTVYDLSSARAVKETIKKIHDVTSRRQ